MRMIRPWVAAQIIGLGVLWVLSASFAQTIAPPPGQPGPYSEPHKTGSTRLGRSVSPVSSAVGPPAFYRLERRAVMDADPKTYVWEVQWRVPTPPPPGVYCLYPPQGVFRSLASSDLRAWIDALPAHSEIVFTWVGNGSSSALKDNLNNSISPALRSEMNNFTLYCKSRGVTFRVEEVFY
jgi:hypothetical protein